MLCDVHMYCYGMSVASGHLPFYIEPLNQSVVWADRSQLDTAQCHCYVNLLLLCLSTPAGAQAADDTPPQFHASQLTVLFHVFSVSTTLRGPCQSFFRYTAASFPQCVPNPGPLPTSNRCLHGILLSHVPQFIIGCLCSWCWRLFLNSCWWILWFCAVAVCYVNDGAIIILCT